jgi:hypothetical protein
VPSVASFFTSPAHAPSSRGSCRWSVRGRACRSSSPSISSSVRSNVSGSSASMRASCDSICSIWAWTGTQAVSGVYMHYRLRRVMSTCACECTTCKSDKVRVSANPNLLPAAPIYFALGLADDRADE